MYIIANIAGGLGNQMFQYAAAYSLAQNKNFKLMLDISDFTKINNRTFQLKYFFNITNSIATNKEVKSILGMRRFFLIRRILKKLNKTTPNLLIEEPYIFNERFLEVENSIYLQGYWQNYNYFLSYKKKLQNIFKLKSLSSKDILFSDHYLKMNNLTSVHIRKGDYINKNNKNIFNQLGTKYYMDSISYIKNMVSKPFFFIFSDDYNWVKDNIKLPHNEYILMDHSLDSLIDFKLMSLCQHHIIANSTFSWWPAWLKDENRGDIVIAPKKWLNTNLEPKGMIMPSWVQI